MPIKTSKVTVRKAVSRKTTIRASIVKPKNILAIEFFDTKGKVKEKVNLPQEIFGAKINEKLMAQAIRVYLANQRGGFASTKTRGEVHGSTRKIYAQKHTGRARHGSRKAPIFIHGGIAHGPQPRDFSLKLSKKMKKLALFSALSSKLKDSQIKGIVGFEKIEPKTKFMAQALSKLGIGEKDRNILIVTTKSNNELENFYRASGNIEGVKLIPANTLNIYEVLNNKLILLMKASIDALKENFLKGENK